MQLTKTIFQNSAIFIEKKWVENRLCGKSAFLWEKELIHAPNPFVLDVPSDVHLEKGWFAQLYFTSYLRPI